MEGVTVRAGAAHFHGNCIGTGFPGPLKVKLIGVFGQVISGTKMLTCVGLPGYTLPLDGVKVMPAGPDADQLVLSRLSASVTVAWHVQPGLEVPVA